MKKLWQVGNIQIIIAGLWYFQKLVPAWHKYDKLVVISNFMISLEQSDLVLMKVCSRYCISFSTLHLQCNRAIRYEILRKQISTLPRYKLLRESEVNDQNCQLSNDL